MAARREASLALALAGILLAGLLVAPLSPANADTAGGVVWAPALSTSKCALNGGGDSVSFHGNAPAGSTIVGALFRDLDANGHQVGTNRDLMKRVAEGQITMDASGELSGSTVAGGLSKPETSVASIVAAITIRLPDGSDVTGVTNPGIPFDWDRPTFKSARTTGAKSLVVQFSEAVTAPDGDSALDWLIDGERGWRISGQDSARTLEVQLATFGEDYQPTIQYAPLHNGTYLDCAGNPLSGAAGLSRQAIDGIAPKIPTIETIDSKDAATVVASSQESPSVVVGNATNGHEITLYRESDSSPGFNPTEDVHLATATVTDGRATFTSGSLPSFGSDGTYTIYATATDTHGNVSKDEGGSPAADPATFKLDRVAPQVTTAQTLGDRVSVNFNEEIVGSNTAADWSISGCPLGCSISSVTGSGDTRVLTVQTGGLVPNGATVSWTRPETGGYTDAAGNPLASFGSLATQGLIAKFVDLEPETGAPTVGTTHSMTASVSDEFGTGVSGIVVGLRALSGPAASRDFDGAGGNPAGVLGSCFTQSNGTCTFSYSSNTVDEDRLQGWIDTDGNPSTFESAAPEARDESTGDQPNQDVIQVGWSAKDAALQLDASPEAADAPVGQPHVVSMQVTARPSMNPLDPAPSATFKGVTVGLRSLQGPNQGFLGTCDTDADGLCNVSYISNSKGSDRLQAWIDRDDDHTTTGDGLADSPEDVDADGLPLLDDEVQDVVDVTWSGIAVLHLNVEPEQTTQKLHTSAPLSFSVLDQDGDAVEGAPVIARVVSGPNAGKQIKCQTGSNGSCSSDFVSAKVGTDVVQGWVDVNGNGFADEPTSGEARDETGGNDDPVQDIVSIDWIVEGLRIDANPEDRTAPVGGTAPIEVAALDSDGRPVEGVPVEARALSGSGSDGCVTTSSGGCTIAFPSSRVGLQQIQVWIDLNGNHSADEATTPEAAADSPGDSPNQDVVQVEWVLEGADLIADASPEKSTVDVGGRHTLTLSATGDSQNKIAGVPLGARVYSGPGKGRQLGTCATSDAGICTISYGEEKGGTDLVLTWIDTDGNGSSNEVSGSPEPLSAAGASDIHNQDVVEVTWGELTPRKLTLAKPAKSLVKFRAPVTLQGAIDGDASCARGVAIEVQRRIAGSSGYSKLAEVASGRDGSWSVSFRPRKTATYRAFVREDAGCASARSDYVPVVVKAKVKARPSSSTVAEGSCTAVRVRVLPNRAGRPVQLQKKTSRGWKTIARRSLTDRSRARFKLCPKGGRGRYRVLWGGDALNDRSSRAFTVRAV